MRSPRLRASTKENSNDNLLRDSPKRNTKKKGLNFSRIPLPSPKNKTKSETKALPDDIKQLEKSIEARLRLKLRIELSSRFHQIQDKYDQEMMSSSSGLTSSFLESYSLQSCKSSNDEETKQNQSFSEKDIHDIEKEIQNQTNRQKELTNELQKKKQQLQSLNDEIKQHSYVQKQLQEEQNSLSIQIADSYSRLSDLNIELESMREQNIFKKRYDESPDSFDGDNDQIDFGLSPPHPTLSSNVPRGSIEITQSISPRRSINQSWFDVASPSRNSLSTSSYPTSYLEEGTEGIPKNPLNTVEIENVESSVSISPRSPRLEAQQLSETLSTESEENIELPKELFRPPYRIKIPLKGAKK